MTFDQWVKENYPVAADDHRLRSYLEAGWNAGFAEGTAQRDVVYGAKLKQLEEVEVVENKETRACVWVCFGV